MGEFRDGRKGDASPKVNALTTYPVSLVKKRVRKGEEEDGREGRERE